MAKNWINRSTEKKVWVERKRVRRPMTALLCYFLVATLVFTGVSFSKFTVSNEASVSADVADFAISTSSVLYTDDADIAWAMSMDNTQKNAWIYYGKDNNPSTVVVNRETGQKDYEAEDYMLLSPAPGQDCPVSVSQVVPNPFQGAAVTFKMNFTADKKDPNTGATIYKKDQNGNNKLDAYGNPIPDKMADPWQVVGYRVTVDLDKTPYLYMKNNSLPANSWFEITIKERVFGDKKDPLWNQTYNVSGVTDTIDLRTIPEFEEGGMQTFLLGLTLIDGNHANVSIPFDYLFIGSEAANPAHKISWSAGQSAAQVGTTGWQHAGFNKLGVGVSHAVSVNDTDCPIRVSQKGINSYLGSAMDFTFDFGNSPEKSKTQAIGIQLKDIDLSKTPYLYLKNEALPKDTSFAIHWEASDATTLPVPDLTQNPDSGYGQKPTFLKYGVECSYGSQAMKIDLTKTLGTGTKTLWVALYLTDEKRSNATISFDYFFIGSEAVDPTAGMPPTVTENNVGWAMTMDETQKTQWQYLGKNNAGELNVSHPLFPTRSDCPVVVKDTEANRFQGSKVNFALDFGDSTLAEKWQLIGIKVTVNTDRYPYLYLGHEIFKGNCWIGLTIGRGLDASNSVTLLTQEYSHSANDIKIDLRNYVGTGEQTFWVKLSFMTADYTPDYMIDYLHIGDADADPTNTSFVTTSAEDYLATVRKLGWSASMNAEQQGKNGWKYGGMPYDGVVCFESLFPNNQNYPVKGTPGAANNYHGAAVSFTMDVRRTEGRVSNLDHYQGVGYQITADLDETPYLYIQNQALDANTSCGIWFTTDSDWWKAKRYGDIITEAYTGKIDLRTALGVTGGKQTFWLKLSFVDGNQEQGVSTYSFDYIFLGNEAANPTKNTVVYSTILTNDDGFTQEINCQFFVKNYSEVAVKCDFMLEIPYKLPNYIDPPILMKDGVKIPWSTEKVNENSSVYTVQNFATYAADEGQVYSLIFKVHHGPEDAYGFNGAMNILLTTEQID